ncbi:MAG: immunity 8 family protein [Actinomycetota bacterium]|nr:immunity 8 family protein [Actinomycetota bacterium]
MRAAIRSFQWDDLRPDRGVDQTINLVMVIGPQDGPGDETFQITVCTPEALTVLLDRDGIVVGRHLLLVGGINKTKIEAFLQDRLRRLDGDNWGGLAEKISRLAYWEFEDYTAPTD